MGHDLDARPDANPDLAPSCAPCSAAVHVCVGFTGEPTPPGGCPACSDDHDHLETMIYGPGGAWAGW